MGGFGSGKKFGADCTEDFRSIDIKVWQCEGFLNSERYFDWQWLRNGEKIAAISIKVEALQLRLIYSYCRNGDDWESLDYPVRLQTTTCNYGGLRYWFTCPAVGCGRRVAMLYLGGKYFACRHCYQLVYQSQRETKSIRGYRGADKIRVILGWEPGIANPIGKKPKGMHWRTYNRMMEKYLAYSKDSFRGMLVILKKVDARFTEMAKTLNH